MGSAVATRLLDAGYELTVWNRTPERADPLVGRGAGRAASPSRAASVADVVITSLSDDAAVRAVCLGENGAVHGIQPDAILVDMSTVSPDTSRMLAGAVSGRFVDAPILGAPAAVLERQAILLLGGDAAMLERLAPPFEDLAARQIHGDHSGWFTMRLGRKDLGLAHALG
jgi:3-hydroxyisobutyrate dehydrogenase